MTPATTNFIDLINYQVSKKVVHEIDFGDNILFYSDSYSNTKWQFVTFKRGKDNWAWY